MRSNRMAAVSILVALLAACSAAQRPPAAPAALTAQDGVHEFGFSSPESQGMDSEPLLDLAKWIRDHPVPVFSLLVSRNGRVVFELYTSSLDRDAAHYLMSVTKAVVAALVGIGIEDKLLPGADASLADALPEKLFPSPDDRARFKRVTIKHLLGMSALDTPDPPRVNTPESIARLRGMLSADNRVRFALAQPLLSEPGTAFLYNDIGPQIATGMLSYASHKTALGFADERLFGPMDFKNFEWMHQDPSGIDNGGYGLRLRPLDMQKFGILYLNRGVWSGHQLVPAAWVDASFEPWIRSSPERSLPDYGWFWWTVSHGPGWLTHEARGWRGQRIVVIPEQQVVVTITANIDDGLEEALCSRVVEDYVIPSVEHRRRRSPADQSAIAAELTGVLEQVRRGPLRGPSQQEPRMIPSRERKEHHEETVR